MVETGLIDGCPCGLQGEDCDQLVAPLLDVANAAGEACDLDGFDFCLVEEDKASCVCDCGNEGEFCEEGVIPLAFNFIVDWILVFGITAWAIHLLIKYSKLRRDQGIVDLTKENFVTSRFDWMQPWMVLAFRAVVSIFFLVNVVFILSFNTREYIFFTQWSFTLFGLSFLTGTACSIRYFMNPESAKEPIGLLEWINQALFSLSVPVALLVTIIFWVILAPDTDPEIVYNGRSISAHGVHFVLISLEFAYSRVWFRFENFTFVWLELAAWIGFHNAYQQVFFHRGEGHCPLYGFADMANPAHAVLLGVFFAAFSGIYYAFYRLSQSFRKKDDIKHGEEKIPVPQDENK